MMNLLFFLAFLSILAMHISADNVKLEVYIESGCPVCQAFFLGELTDVLSLPDIRAVTDFKFVPFGNAFYNGTIESYQCYDEMECQTDALELCSMYKIKPLNHNLNVILTGENSYKAFPFISCMESNQGLPDAAESCWKSTMAEESRTSWEEIYACSKTEFLRVMTAGDLATPHWLEHVPLALVNSVQYDTNSASLLSTICNAYTGSPTPSSCSTRVKA